MRIFSSRAALDGAATVYPGANSCVKEAILDILRTSKGEVACNGNQQRN